MPGHMDMFRRFGHGRRKLKNASIMGQRRVSAEQASKEREVATASFYHALVHLDWIVIGPPNAHSSYHPTRVFRQGTCIYALGVF